MNDNLPALATSTLTDVIAHAKRFDISGRRQNPFADQLGAIIEHNAGRLPVLDVDFRHAAAQLQLAAQTAETANQVFQNHSHAFERASEAFQITGAKHDAELAEVHIVFASVAVPHQRTNQHLDQQRIADVFGQSPREPNA